MPEIDPNLPPAGTGAGTELSLRDMLLPLARRKTLATAVFASLGCVAIGFCLVSGPKYSSHMSILVNRQRMDPLVSTEPNTPITTASDPMTEEEINSEVELLRSRDVLEKVATANGMDLPSSGFSLAQLLHPQQTRQDRLARAAKSLATKLKVKNPTKSNLIDVEYSSPDPQLSYGILKSLGEVYPQKHVAVHRAAGSYEFFAKETERYRQALADAETNLRNAGTESGIAAPDAQRANLALQLANTIGQLHGAEQSMAADQSRLASDLEQMKNIPERTPTLQTSAPPDKLLSDLNTSLLAAETKRTQLASKYAADYPLVREAEAEVAETKTAIDDAEKLNLVSKSTDKDPTYELLRQDAAKAQADYSAQSAYRDATSQSIEAIQAQLVQLDQQAITQQDLLREVKANEDNYLLYLAKREQERTSDALDATSIANVSIAVPPAIPVLPVLSLPTMILIGLAGSALVSVVVAYIADMLDPSYQTSAQVAETLGIPMVISINRVA